MAGDKRAGDTAWIICSSRLFEILSFGAIVVLVVLGLGIIASMMGIFNFAQGEFVLLGAYVTYIVHSAGLPVWLGMLAAPFVVGALGFRAGADRSSGDFMPRRSWRCSAPMRSGSSFARSCAA